MKSGTGRVPSFRRGKYDSQITFPEKRDFIIRDVDLVSGVHSSRTFFSIPGRIYLCLL